MSMPAVIVAMLLSGVLRAEPAAPSEPLPSLEALAAAATAATKSWDTREICFVSPPLIYRPSDDKGRPDHPARVEEWVRQNAQGLFAMGNIVWRNAVPHSRYESYWDGKRCSSVSFRMPLPAEPDLAEPLDVTITGLGPHPHAFIDSFNGKFMHLHASEYLATPNAKLLGWDVIKSGDKCLLVELPRDVPSVVADKDRFHLRIWFDPKRGFWPVQWHLTTALNDPNFLENLVTVSEFREVQGRWFPFRRDSVGASTRESRRSVYFVNEVKFDFPFSAEDCRPVLRDGLLIRDQTGTTQEIRVTGGERGEKIRMQELLQRVEANKQMAAATRPPSADLVDSTGSAALWLALAGTLLLIGAVVTKRVLKA